MKRKLALSCTSLVFCLTASQAPLQAGSVARDWNEEMLQAIRINVPNPPSHARNLFHTAVAMYNAWAAYAPAAVGYIYNEKAFPMPLEAEAERRETISYAAYTVLRARFSSGEGAATTLANLNARLTLLGYDVPTAQAPASNDATPAELGKRIGRAVLNWSAGDGFSNLTYPEPYDWLLNGNLLRPHAIFGTNTAGNASRPLGGAPIAGTDPNLWQPLSFFSTGTNQNGLPNGTGTQSFVGAQSLATVPFALQRTDNTRPWIDPGPPSKISRMVSGFSETDSIYRQGALAVVRASSLLNDETIIDISPGTTGNHPLGADTGTGRPLNPVTNLPYAANPVKRGDFTRVLAEFWADGPRSETPPGHWHVLANQLSDTPGFIKKIHGAGPAVNDLEWDVKTYFALSAATHDAACAAWALKRFYSGVRPITMIRYMCGKGQSSNPSLPGYHEEGMPLQDGVAELITAESSAPGGRHEQLWSLAFDNFISGSFYIGKVAVKSWPGEHLSNPLPPEIATHRADVKWMLGTDWVPFQRAGFNTPAFPGYVSGHSTFSRAAAEVLTLHTGSPYFPGGLGKHRVLANTMQIDLGPSTDVELQWSTFYDAADQAGQSRIWGGIHVSEDDYAGRRVGSTAGKSAYALAEQYWTGAIADTTIGALITMDSGAVKVSWNATRGMYHKVQTSTNLRSWADATSAELAYDNKGEWRDLSPEPGNKFYRVIRQDKP